MTCSIGVAVLLACAIALYGLTLTSSAAAKVARRDGLMRSAPPKAVGDNHGASVDGRSPHGGGNSFAGRRCQFFVTLVKILSFTFGDCLLCAFKGERGSYFCRSQQQLRRVGEAAASAGKPGRGGRWHAVVRLPHEGSQRNRSDFGRRGGGRLASCESRSFSGSSGGIERTPKGLTEWPAAAAFTKTGSGHPDEY
jgi:hypothetical protein